MKYIIAKCGYVCEYNPIQCIKTMQIGEIVTIMVIMIIIKKVYMMYIKSNKLGDNLSLFLTFLRVGKSGGKVIMMYISNKRR